MVSVVGIIVLVVARKRTLAVAKIVGIQALHWLGLGPAAEALALGFGLAELPSSVRGAEERILALLAPGHDREELSNRADFQDADKAAARALERSAPDPLAVVADLDAVKAQIVPFTSVERAKLKSPDAQSFFDQFINAGLHVLKDVAIAEEDFPIRAQARSLQDHAMLKRDLQNLNDGVAGLPQRIGLRAAQPTVETYLASVRALALTDMDRSTERARAWSFASQEQQRWLWWQAAPWAGKTTLMADLAINPPTDVQTAVFLTIGRNDTLNDRAAFYTRVTPQLALLAGHSTVDFSALDPGLRHDDFCRLLAEAGDNSLRKGKRLLLLVDGLDEDRQRGGSIASALPPDLPPGVNVLVASRSNPALPVPYTHPLSTDKWAEPLVTSPGAQASREQAMDELNQLWRHDNGLGRTLICLTAAAGAPLAAVDLAELSAISAGLSIDLPTVQQTLKDQAARVLHRTALPSGAMGYQIGHELLDEQIIRNLNPRLPVQNNSDEKSAWTKERQSALAPWREHIHEWVAGYELQRWPVESPGYAGEPYFALLKSIEDTDRIIKIASDPNRHEFLYRTTLSEQAAYREVSAALDHLASIEDADVETMAELAVYKHLITQRTNEIPAGILPLLANLGQARRAEQLARAILDPYAQTLALLSIAEVLVTTDSESATVLCHEAQQVAREITDEDQHVDALASVARVVADMGPVWAEQMAAGITDQDDREQVLVSVVEVVAVSDPVRAEHLAGGISDRSWRAEALASVARVVAVSDAEHARDLSREAEQVARGITDRYGRELALATVARVVAVSDPVRAEQVARGITGQGRRAETLASVAEVVAASDAEHARDLSREAEQVARGITDWGRRGQALATVARVVAVSDPVRAEQVAGGITHQGLRAEALASVVEVVAVSDPVRAEQVARGITDQGRRAEALASVARGVVATDPEHANALGCEALEIARLVTNVLQQSEVLATVARVVAVSDPVRAEQLARGITYGRELALASVAEVVAVSDPVRAEQVARGITDQGRRAEALATVAEVVAVSDPVRAEHLARGVTDRGRRAEALASVARVVAVSDPERGRSLSREAEHVARGITSRGRRDQVLATVARVVAVADPVRAEQLARGITDQGRREHVLVSVVEVVAVSDPVRAQQLAGGISDRSWRAEALASVALVVAVSDAEHARDLSREAEQVARGITDRGRRELALASVARVVAVSDPVRAEQMARTISDPSRQLLALLSLSSLLDSSACRRIARDGLRTGFWFRVARSLASVEPTIIDAVAAAALKIYSQE